MIKTENKAANPDCPKCGKPMSTGSMVRTFYCCGERKIVEREDVK
jgi:endogenous inhibitor of DNA gyrase (YacG/DUF329 family)